jgi:hypothetical protein
MGITATEDQIDAVRAATIDLLLDIREFEASIGATTKRFDGIANLGREAIIDLKSDWQNITSVTLDGTALTSGDDYELLARNRRGFPYEAIKFLRMVPRGNSVVTVAGFRGFEAIPESALLAYDYLLASRILENQIAAASMAASGGEVSEEKIGDHTVKFTTTLDAAKVGIGSPQSYANLAYENLERYMRYPWY